ncbi:MAG: hypothetical protein CO141_01880 [Candidatus Moranbacteria bacterium CG_4_9_14_3_um_filter_42_9]|nr:MAG: hypothetical protein CO141_01880 [Candidatus Moranbacteria bacterium CG_4_9_14_3_um_filter_42_9]
MGVTGYILTEAASQPAAGAAGWTSSAPASYTFSSAGTKTLYAWAKDAAGNVSASRSGTVIVTIVSGSTLIGHWKLDSGTNANDSSSSNLDGTLSGSPAWTTGLIDGALNFDGSNDYVYLPSYSLYNVDPGEKRTFSAWFKAGAQTDTRHILWNEGGCRGWYASLNNTGQVQWSFSTSPSSCSGPTWHRITTSGYNYADNQWHLFTGVIDRPNNQMELFMDGVSQGTAAIDNINPGSGGYLKFGTMWDNSVFFAGTIDDVRAYDGALSSSEVQALYDASAATSSLIGHWKLDDGLGAERIPNGNFGTNITGWQKTGVSTLAWQNAASGDGSTGYMRFNIASNVDYDRFATNNSPSVTAANTTYAVSFWYRTSGITGNLQAYSGNSISTLGTTVSWASDEIAPSSSWRYYSTSITTDVADFPLFGISKLGDIGSGTLDIDAISVKTTASAANIAVDSADSHNGTLTNGTPWTAGKIGGALNLDGTDDYVDIGTFNFGNVFSISAWVNIDSGASNIQTIMANAGSGAATNGFRIFVNQYGTSDQSLWIETGNGSTGDQAVSATGVVSYPGWHHIVAIVDRANGLANAYVDNIQVITNDSILTDFWNNQTTHIGQMTNNTYRMGGKIDDVRIYNKALSASEVQALYNAGD